MPRLLWEIRYSYIITYALLSIVFPRLAEFHLAEPLFDVILEQTDPAKLAEFVDVQLLSFQQLLHLLFYFLQIAETYGKMGLFMSAPLSCISIVLS
jgi:hypothetical protein